MLIEMKSPVFKEQGQERPPIEFKEGLNVILGKEDGAMSIGKSSALLAIDFVFGGDTYVKSDGVKHEGNHTIFFAFEFDGIKYYFARNTEEPNKIIICDGNYEPTCGSFTKNEYADWLKEKYNIHFVGLSFNVVRSSFFRVYGKKNTDETSPLQGIRGYSMEKSINTLLTVYDKYKDIEEFKNKVTEQRDKLNAYKKAREYKFISDLVGGQKEYENNLARIRKLEMDPATLKSSIIKEHTDDEIELHEKKANLLKEKLSIESTIQAKERKYRLVNMNLDYGLYPTKADVESLQEFFPGVNIRKIYEIEKYHQKLAKILDEQFKTEKIQIEKEISELKKRLEEINTEIKNLGIVGDLSNEFLDRFSEINTEISALRIQNDSFLNLKELQKEKSDADKILKKSIDDILKDIEDTINAKMEAFNDTLFKEKKKPPHLHFNSHNSYTFETPDNTGTGSNYKGMIVYDLAVLFTSNLPALAHDSLLFVNLGKDVEDGIMKIYSSTKKTNIYIP